jgi:p-aminobenzoyl-glutamate transporter AbgT
MATVITKLPVIRPGALVAANVGAAGFLISSIVTLGLFIASTSPTDVLPLQQQQQKQQQQQQQQPKLQITVQDKNNIGTAGQAFSVITVLFAITLVLSVFCINVPNQTIQLPSPTRV